MTKWTSKTITSIDIECFNPLLYSKEGRPFWLTFYYDDGSQELQVIVGEASYRRLISEIHEHQPLYTDAIRAFEQWYLDTFRTHD